MSVTPNFTGTGPTPLPIPVTYFHGNTPVLPGDHVRVRWWLRRRPGRVTYVPGVSPFRKSMEFNGLSWVGISLSKGWGIGVYVEPTTLQLKKTVVFLERGPADVEFKTDEPE